jgi:hypothetical protein
MENHNAFHDESMARRSPTPGGMYRRAEMRAHAESMALAGAIAAAPVELPTDAPAFFAPDVVAAIGHVDPLVGTIAPLADTVAYTPVHIPGRASIRRRRMVLATIALGVSAVMWVAWPTGSITTPAPAPQAAPVAAIPSVPTPTPSIVQSLPAASASTTPNEPPARTRALEPVLRITSDPAGARVTVNGVGWGSTPVAIRNLSSGPKTVRVTKEGYVAVERVVSLSGSSPGSVQLKLRRVPDRPAAPTTGIRQR